MPYVEKLAACGGCGDCVLCLSSIPRGLTCNSCRSFERCSAVGVAKPDQRHCDWIPSHFLLRPGVLETVSAEG